MGAEFDRIRRSKICAGGPGRPARANAAAAALVMSGSGVGPGGATGAPPLSGPFSRFLLCAADGSRTLDERLRRRPACPPDGPLCAEADAVDEDDDDEPSMSSPVISFRLRWRLGTKRLLGRKWLKLAGSRNERSDGASLARL